MLHHGHRQRIDLAVGRLPSGDPVLEIDAFCGLSTNVITDVLRRHGRPNRLVVSTDPWQFDRNVRFWSGDRLPNALELASNDFFAAWRLGGMRTDVFGREAELGGPLAFASIDGDHSNEQALFDFHNVDGLVAANPHHLVGKVPGRTATMSP